MKVKQQPTPPFSSSSSSSLFAVEQQFFACGEEEERMNLIFQLKSHLGALRKLRIWWGQGSGCVLQSDTIP